VAGYSEVAPKDLFIQRRPYTPDFCSLSNVNHLHGHEKTALYIVDLSRLVAL